MKKKCILTVGFLAVMAATGAANAPNSSADTRRVDVIENTKGMVTQLDSTVPHNTYADARLVDVSENTEGMVMQLETVEGQKGRVDVIDSIRPGGARYPYTNPISH
ncbi:MAG: hypothetical protein KF722_04965 [Nitrospira sp.]|nr:hypothetical protein [Nitrospira sp.]